jgi:outer membrane lipopolysaccharide assembly protein LptE/RlpB
MVRLGAILLTFFLGLAMAGCGGWQLRGVGQNTVADISIYVVEKNARSVGRAFREQWSSLGGDLVAVGDADFTLIIEQEQYVRSLLSVSPKTGKAREINLKLEVKFSMRSNDGTLLIAEQVFGTERDFIFDETSVYGSNENSAVLKEALAKLVAIEIAVRASSSAVAYREK